MRSMNFTADFYTLLKIAEVLFYRIILSQFQHAKKGA